MASSAPLAMASASPLSMRLSRKAQKIRVIIAQRHEGQQAHFQHHQQGGGNNKILSTQNIGQSP
jgi:hypothetical protein